MFVIVLDGVYRHGICGVFDTEKKAIKAGLQVIEKEKDDWHNIVILKYKINDLVDDGQIIGNVRKVGYINTYNRTADKYHLENKGHAIFEKEAN